MSLSMQIYIQLLKRTLAKVLTQHLMCLKNSVISFSVKSLIIVDASLLDQGFCISKRSACMLLCEVFGHLLEKSFFWHIILEALMHRDSICYIHPFKVCKYL